MEANRSAMACPISTRRATARRREVICSSFGFGLRSWLPKPADYPWGQLDPPGVREDPGRLAAVLRQSGKHAAKWTGQKRPAFPFRPRCRPIGAESKAPTDQRLIASASTVGPLVALAGLA